MSVVFEEPVTPKPRRASWPERLEPLKKRPGEWARVFESKNFEAARTYTYALRRGGYAVPEGQFEFRVGDLGDDRGAVYARYIGTS